MMHSVMKIFEWAMPHYAVTDQWRVRIHDCKTPDICAPEYLAWPVLRSATNWQRKQEMWGKSLTSQSSGEMAELVMA